MFTSLSRCRCKTSHRWGSALMFLLPHNSQAGHQLESACTLNASSFLSLPSLKHNASTVLPKMEHGTSEWVCEKQKTSLEFHIPAEIQLNKELTWYQTRSHHFYKILVHYVGMKIQEEIQKAPRETRGFSVSAHFTGPCPIQLLLQIANTHA